MRARVLVGGWALDSFGVVSGLEDSMHWRIGDYSGTTEVKCQWAAPVRFSAPWLRFNARVQVVEGGVVTREGRLSEFNPGDPWEIVAEGLGARLANTPTVANGEVTTLADQAAKSPSVYFSDGITTWAPPANWARTWIIRPSSASLGVDASSYVSRVTPFYVPSGSTTPVLGSPVVDAVLEARYGTSGKVLDASAAAPMTSDQAQALALQRLDAGGRRLGLAGEVTLTDGQFLSGTGAPGRAMSVRAGDLLLIPGLTDPSSRDSYSATFGITAGEVIRSHDEAKTVVRPMGAANRDLESIWASVPAPDSEASVIVL